MRSGRSDAPCRPTRWRSRAKERRFQLARLISKCPNLNTLFIDTLDVSPTPNCIQPGALDRLTTLRVEQVWGKCSLGTSRVFWLVAKAPSLEHLALGWLRGMVLGACANQKRRCTLKTLTLSCSDSNSEAPIDPAALKWLIDGGEDGRPVPKLILDATGMWSTPEKLGPAWRAALAQVTDVLPALEVVNFGCDFLLLASPNAFAEATVAFASLWTHDDAERPRSRSNDAVLLHRPVHPADLGLSDQREREVEAQTREVWLPGLSGGRALTALKRVDIVQELKYRPLWKRGRTVPSNPAAVLDASWEPFFIRRPGCEPIEVHFKMQLLEFPTDEAAQRALPKYLAVAFC